jgi:hypothetical protein
MCHVLLRQCSGGLSHNRDGHSLNFETADLQLKKESNILFFNESAIIIIITGFTETSRVEVELYLWIEACMWTSGGICSSLSYFQLFCCHFCILLRIILCHLCQLLLSPSGLHFRKSSTWERHDIANLIPSIAESKLSWRIFKDLSVCFWLKIFHTSWSRRERKCVQILLKHLNNNENNKNNNRN